MSIIFKIKNSAKELSSVLSISIGAMLLAMRVVLGLFANFTLSFSPFAKISLNFIPIVIAAYILGPVPCAIISALGDIISIFISNPTAVAINPAITLTCLLEGFLYGIILYKCEIKYKNIIISKILVLIICNLLMTTFILAFLYSTPFYIVLINRVLVLVPVSILEVFIDYYMLKLTDKIYKRK